MRPLIAINVSLWPVIQDQRFDFSMWIFEADFSFFKTRAECFFFVFLDTLSWRSCTASQVCKCLESLRAYVVQFGDHHSPWPKICPAAYAKTIALDFNLIYISWGFWNPSPCQKSELVLIRMLANKVNLADSQFLGGLGSPIRNEATSVVAFRSTIRGSEGFTTYEKWIKWRERLVVLRIVNFSILQKIRLVWVE